MASGSRLRDQGGFTIIEVLVATTLLVIGILGTMALVDTSNARTNDTKGREGATNLAREVVEGARTLGYQQLEPSTIKADLQAMPGLANQGIAWTVKRRGFAYTVVVSVCSVDDSKDGYGSHDSTFCRDSSTTGTADAKPKDYKRVTVDISWKSLSRTQTLRQVALVATDGVGGPAVTALVATAPVVPNPEAPVISSPAITSVAFKATAPAGVSSVIYSVDGEDKGSATAAANGTDWTFTMPLAGLSDGGYDVSVRAVDGLGVAGPSFSIPLSLVRSAPAAPADLVGGLNTVYVNGAPTPVIELEWNANSERNVLGYRAYNSSGGLVCPATTQTLSTQASCIDFAETGGPYTVVALYRNAAGVVSEGPPSSVSITKPIPRTFYFKSTVPSSGTNCGTATSQRDMVEGFGGLDPESTFARSAAGVTINFCSPALPASEILTAGPASFTVYLDNANKSSCVVTGQLFRSGTTTPLTSPVSETIAGSTPVQTITRPLGTVPATTLAAGERLNMLMTWDTTNPCNQTRLHYGGTTYRSSLTVPARATAVPKPTNLSAATLPDGMTQLSWSAPPGPPVSFYRIYRDGINYTDRYDTTGLSTTYVDDPGGTSHQYRVTAVNASLTESVMEGPVTK